MARAGESGWRGRSESATNGGNVDKPDRFRQTGAMKRTLGLLAVAVGMVAISARAHAASEIVVAIRYLQAQGESHSHLFLFRDDGTFLRQLTKPDSGQDLDPIFAPDGETIVFSREIGENKFEYWSVEPKGAEPKRLDAAPDWYSAAQNSSYFVWPDTGSGDDENAPAFGQRTPTFRAPDSSVELVLREKKEDEADQENGPGHGKHYLLRDLKSKKEGEFGKLPGFEGAVDQLELKGGKDRFLLEPGLRLAFFGVHLNSTDGDTDYALDLTNRRFVRLSPNWAAPIPLPGEPAFLTMTYVRYVPIPGSKKTANCSYLERWDQSLKKVRFARDRTAAVCYGASIYRPGKTPAIVTIRKSGD
ncbi:MAG: hypothetical protein DLM73_17610 [Chthoniobacterales bacterium]|nr:MAG: hypothetical protein DLM73_17610 [Chthoniobacterales bacterium]